MFSFERHKLVKCQTASIVEDLGQVNYIFTDKTGTLTRNVMEFKYMLVGNEFYGNKAQFVQEQEEEGANELNKFNEMKKSIKRPSYIDPNKQPAVQWISTEYTEVMANGGRDINR